MNYIVLKPLAIESQGNEHVRHCSVLRVDGDTQVDKKDLWFQFSNSVIPPEDKDCDSYLLSVFMDAMAEKRDIIVKGSVSLGLLSNLIEYQSAWNKWLPETYSIIDIKVETVRENEHPASGAICAFSGGIDSMFSVWRHSQGKNGYRSQNIKLCTLVHGFDIPLKDKAAFSNVIQRSTKTLDDVGLKVLPIKTNCRIISSVNWQHSHGSGLVATLANFKSVAGTCIVGSTYPYNYLSIPWGSTPVVDYLLSSDEFVVMHDGASHTRTEKVNEISGWNVGVENLRVCWQGDMNDRNCGKCEKCVRTKLNFLACGCTIPSCFDKDDDAGIDFKNIVLKTEGIRGDWKQIIDYANKNGVNDSWVVEVKKVIKRKPMMSFIFPQGSYGRLVALNIAKKIGLR